MELDAPGSTCLDVLWVAAHHVKDHVKQQQQQHHHHRMVRSRCKEEGDHVKIGILGEIEINRIKAVIAELQEIVAFTENNNKEDINPQHQGDKVSAEDGSPSLNRPRPLETEDDHHSHHQGSRSIRRRGSPEKKNKNDDHVVRQSTLMMMSRLHSPTLGLLSGSAAAAGGGKRPCSLRRSSSSSSSIISPVNDLLEAFLEDYQDEDDEQQQQQAGQAHQSSSSGQEGSDLRSSSTSQETVLNNTDLLGEVMGTLISSEGSSSGSKTTRKVLGQLSLVSPRWKDVSRRSCYWSQIMTSSLPCLAQAAAEEAAAAASRRGGGGCDGKRRCITATEQHEEEDQGNMGGGDFIQQQQQQQQLSSPHQHWSYMCDYGRNLLVNRRLVMRDEWLEGCYDVGFEVWDASDNLRLLSCFGPMEVDVNDDMNIISVFLASPYRHEVVGPAFSAASRDPRHLRFTDIVDYFTRQHEPSLPSALCIRTVLKCRRSGRIALLWESRKETTFRVESSDREIRPCLAPESLYVEVDGWTSIDSLSNSRTSMCPSSSFHTIAAAEGVSQQNKMKAGIGFHIEPYHPSSSSTAEQQVSTINMIDVEEEKYKLWQMAGMKKEEISNNHRDQQEQQQGRGSSSGINVIGDEGAAAEEEEEEEDVHHESYIYMSFDTCNQEQLGRFMHSLFC